MIFAQNRQSTTYHFSFINSQNSQKSQVNFAAREVHDGECFMQFFIQAELRFLECPKQQILSLGSLG